MSPEDRTRIVFRGSNEPIRRAIEGSNQFTIDPKDSHPMLVRELDSQTPIAVLNPQNVGYLRHQEKHFDLTDVIFSSNEDIEIQPSNATRAEYIERYQKLVR